MRRLLTREQLARAVRTEPQEIDALVERGMLRPDLQDRFRPSDIQRARAVQAMRSPGIELDQLIEAFREEMFTLQPMDLLYPEPASVTDTTVRDLAESLGMDPQQLLHAIIAAGFPAPLPDEPMRDDDLELIQLVVEVGSKMGDEESLLRTARMFGDSSRRVAESAVALFEENINSPVVRSRADEAARMEVNRLAAELMGKSEIMLARLYRRHLEHALLRMWAASAERFLDELGVRPARPTSPGLAFVDLTGYTRLTETSGDAIAARLAAHLGDLAETIATGRNGRVVKLLGDGAMLHFGEPLDGVRGALEMVDRISASDLPPAHAGVHSGPLIRRDGDYFGRTVNVAARISGQASPGQVLVSSDVGTMIASDVAFRPVGRRELKGIGEMALFEATWRTSQTDS